MLICGDRYSNDSMTVQLVPYVDHTQSTREKNLHVLMREKYNNILIRQPRTQVNLQKEELGKAAMTKQDTLK